MVTEETPTGQNHPESDNSSVTDLDNFQLESFQLAEGLGGTSMVLVHTVCEETVDDPRGLDEMVSGWWTLGDVIRAAQAHNCSASESNSDSVTDLDRLRALLDSWAVPHRDGGWMRPHEVSLIIAEPDDPHGVVEGRPGSFTRFVFTEEGSFLRMGAYE